MKVQTNQISFASRLEIKNSLVYVCKGTCFSPYFQIFSQKKCVFLHTLTFVYNYSLARTLYKKITTPPHHHHTTTTPPHHHHTTTAPPHHHHTTTPPPHHHIFAEIRTQSHPGSLSSEAPDAPWHINSLFFTEVNWIALYMSF